jgi:tight adherence protein C
VLDLLSLNVEAGLGFEQALLHVIEHFDGFLIDELMITHREITMGRTRREALTLFAERCGLNEVKSFVGAVIQAGQMGIPLKNVLRTQAAAMRTSRKNKIEEKAMKISVKILLPMVLFIFPVLFIVLLGPAVVKIINQFKG